MVLPPKVIHPKGEPEFTPKKSLISALIAETFNGKIHIEWEPQADVTTLGQLAFFIQFLKMGHLFMPWVDACPLFYKSPNAPPKLNFLGTFVLSILAGHTRYAHMFRVNYLVRFDDNYSGRFWLKNTGYIITFLGFVFFDNFLLLFQ